MATCYSAFIIPLFVSMVVTAYLVRLPGLRLVDKRQTYYRKIQYYSQKQHISSKTFIHLCSLGKNCSPLTFKELQI